VPDQATRTQVDVVRSGTMHGDTIAVPRRHRDREVPRPPSPDAALVREEPINGGCIRKDVPQSTNLTKAVSADTRASAVCTERGRREHRVDRSKPFAT